VAGRGVDADPLLGQRFGDGRIMIDYPLLADYRDALNKSMLPFLGGTIGALSADAGYCDDLEDLLALLRRAYPHKPWPKWSAGGTLRFNRMIIQEELEFRKSATYSRRPEDSALVNEEIYSSSEVMDGFYLVGLLLSYFTWFHHKRILDFYRARFLRRPGGAVGRVMEWGVGHGLFSLLAARAWPVAWLTAVDISQHSLDFTRRLLAADAVTQRVEFVLQDILEPHAELPVVDRLICSELMEHVAEPPELAKRMATVLAPGGCAFVTAAINAPQPDHIYLFRSPQEVEELIRSVGLIVEAALPVGHPHNEGRDDAPTVLAMVVSKGDAG
jgi:SAM-dependent methyltransferase